MLAHGLIVFFHIRRGNKGFHGCADYAALADTAAFAGTVFALRAAGVRRRAVVLHKHRVINVNPEGPQDGVEVDPMTVRGFWPWGPSGIVGSC